MEPNRDSKTVNKLAGLLAYGLTFTGLSLVMVSVIASDVLPTWAVAFIRDLGLLLAAVMAGTILHEKLLRDETIRLVEKELDSRLGSVTSRTAGEVHKLLCERPPGMTGIRFVNGVRRNFKGYYGWVTTQEPQDLFFAGRSVLHRIHADIRTRLDNSAEEILLRKLKEGSKVRVLFLDPRTNILERLAHEEGQTMQAMLGDIATSIGICERLARLLRLNLKELRPEAELSIRVYDRVPYFAYHKQDEQVIVGFYFLSAKGSSSAAYELVDDRTKEAFGDHFLGIMSEAATNTVLEFDGARGHPTFNESLCRQLRECVAAHLGKEKTEELVGWQ